MRDNSDDRYDKEDDDKKDEDQQEMIEQLKRDELMGQLVVKEVVKHLEEVEKRIQPLEELQKKMDNLMEQSKKHKPKIVIKKVTMSE